MEKIVDILNLLYGGNGFSFQKEFTIPWINKKVTSTIIVKSKNPTKFVFNSTDFGGQLKFEQNGPQITIKEFGIQSTLTGLHFTKDKVVFELSGFPDLTYTF